MAEPILTDNFLDPNIEEESISLSTGLANVLVPPEKRPAVTFPANRIRGSAVEAGMMLEGDPFGTAYENVYEELLEGNHEGLAMLQKWIAEDDNDLVVKSIQTLVDRGELGIDAGQEIMRQVFSNREVDPYRRKEQMVESIFLWESRQEGTPLSEREVLEAIAGPRLSQDTIKERDQEIIQEWMRETNEGAGFFGALLDLTELAITPLLEGIGLARLGSKLDTKNPFLVNVLFGGEVTHEIRERLKNAPLEKRDEYLRLVLDAVDKSVVSWTGGNDFAKYELANRIVGEAAEQGEADWDRIVTNIVTVLDVAVVGRAVKKASDVVKAIKNTPAFGTGTPIDILTQTNPRLAKQALEAAVNDEDLARALGTGIDEIVGTVVLPKAPGVPIRGGPDVLAKIGDSLGEETEAILRRSLMQGGSLSPADRMRAYKSTYDRMVEVTSPSWHASKSSARIARVTDPVVLSDKTLDAPLAGNKITENGYEIEMVFGNGPSLGFHSLEEVNDGIVYANDLIDNIADVTVSMRQSDGTVVDVMTVQELRSGNSFLDLDALKADLDRLDHTELRDFAPGGSVANIADQHPFAQTIAELRKTIKEIEGGTNHLSFPVPGNKVLTSHAKREEAINAIESINRSIDDLNADLKPGDPARIRKLKASRRNAQRRLDRAQNNLLDTNGEYFFRIKVRELFDPADQSMFGMGGAPVHTGGVGRKHIVHPASKFSKAIVYSAHRAVAFGARMARQMAQSVRPFTKLSNESKLRVDAALAAGDLEGRKLQPLDLVGRFKMNAEEMQGFYAVRNFYDAIWVRMNYTYRRRMVKEGYRMLEHVSSETGKSRFYNFVQPLAKDKVGSVKTAMDPETRKVIALNQKEIKAIYEAGGSIGRSISDLKKGADQTPYVIVHDSGFLKNLPAHALKYNQGYIPRIYKDGYFVRGYKLATVNGSKEQQLVPHTLEVAATKGDAERRVRALEANTDGTYVKFDQVVSDKDFPGEDILRKDFEAIESQGLPFYSKRKKHLSTVFDHNQIQPAPVFSPAEMLTRNVASVSRQWSHEGFVKGAKNAFVNAYGKGGRFSKNVALPENSKGESIWPSDRSLLRPHDVHKFDRDYQKALDLYDYIRFMEGMQPLPAQMWRGVMANLADRLSADAFGKLGNLAAKVALSRKDAGPMRAARSLAFTMFIALNPARQLLLQAQQALFIAPLAPKYFFGGKLFRDMGSLAAGLSTDLKPEMYKHARVVGAKAMGITEVEYDQFIVAIRDSGILESVDAHSFLAPKLFQTEQLNRWTNEFGERNIPAAMYNVAKTAILSPAELGKRIGFNSGERFNSLASWLVARRMYADDVANQGKAWSSPEGLFQIQGRARDLALGMVKSDAFNYQHGWLANAFQFLSIQHKVLGSITPKFMFGVDSFTPAQKWRLASGQLLFWGTAGYGAAEAWNWFKGKAGLSKEIANDPKLKLLDRYVEGGIIDASLLLLANDGDTGLAFSKDFSPASGVTDTFYGWFQEAAQLEGRSQFAAMAVALGGASGQAISKIGNIFEAARWLGERETLTTSEKLVEVANQLGRLSSGYSRFVQAKAAHATGYLATTFQDRTVELSTNEAFFSALGIEPYEQEAVFNTLRTMGNVDKEYREFAKTFTERLLAVTKDLPEHERSLGLWERAIKEEASILRAFDDDPIALRTIMGYVFDEVKVRHTATQPSMFHRMVSIIARGSGGTKEEAINFVANNETWTHEDRKQLMWVIEQYYGPDQE